MKKRLVSLLLCAVMLCALALPAMAAQDPVTVHIFGVNVTVPETDRIIPTLEEKLGIDIEIETTTTGDDSALSTKVYGGNIPDVFRVTNLNNLKELYESEVPLDLTNYLDKMPHLRDLFGEMDWARVTFNGGIYAIPRRGEKNYNCWYIRTDWLDKLGVEAPKTFDDLLAIAVKMKDSDLDGNGKNDTYALSGTYDSTYNRSAFDGFYSAYNVAGPAEMIIRDGKAVLSCQVPEFKECIEQIRRFVDAGVVDPEIVSNTNNVMLEKMATGKVGIAYGGWANYNKPHHTNSLKAVDPNAEWKPMTYNIATQYGVSGAAKSASGYDAVYAINADLVNEPEKLEAVLKLFDYIATPEGDRLLSFGIENTHYEVKDGVIVKLPEMDKLTYGYGIQFTGRDDMLYCMTKFANCADIIEYCANELPIVYHYGAMVEQPEGVNVADIKAYILEQVAQFIFGTRSMDQYDDFINTLFTSYKLQGYLDVATEKLTEIGYIK